MYYITMTTNRICLKDLESMPPIVKTAKKGKYTIRNLQPEYLPNANYNMRIYRSVIENEHGEIICIAPAKSLSDDVFKQVISTGDYESNEIRITEIIEGIMINLFWDADKWEIATKRSVGSNCHFFRTKYFADLPEPEQTTFRQMFFDGLNGEISSSKEPHAGSLDDFANSINLEKNNCYSFVVQHPANHIVANIGEPAVYLVSCYEILKRDADDTQYRYVDVHDIKHVFEGTRVKFPRFYNEMCERNATIENAFLQGENRKYLVGQETSIIDNIVACMQNPLNSFAIPGVMVTHIPTGMRMSYPNLAYAEMKMLRGNNPNLHYQYLVLRKINKVDMFVHHFPQYRAHFARFREHFDTFVNRIHRLYLNVHVLKISKLDEVEDKRDKYHIEKLHYEHYIPALKEFKKMPTDTKPKITRKMVVQYLDSENVMAL